MVKDKESAELKEDRGGKDTTETFIIIILYLPRILVFHSSI